MQQINTSLYGIQLLDDLHNYFPDILYNPFRFNSVTDLIDYVRNVAINRSPYIMGLDRYNNQRNIRNVYVPPPPAYPPSNASPLPSPPSTTTIHASPSNPRQPSQPQTSTNSHLRQPIQAASIQISTIPISYDDNDDGIINEDVLSILQSLLGGGNTNVNLNRNIFENVVVRPSRRQIDAATTVFQNNNLSENCAICLDTIQENTNVRKINHCGHTFHKRCIDTWLSVNVRCPVCRHDIRELNNRRNRTHDDVSDESSENEDGDAGADENADEENNNSQISSE